jgi:hypothetical protein
LPFGVGDIGVRHGDDRGNGWGHAEILP